MATPRRELMPASIRLGRVGGIPIGLHFSWLIIAVLITLSLAARFTQTHADWSPLTVWSVAAATALLFFASLIAHELAHSLVARARGLSVRSITLFALGGVAHIEKEATSARTEFLVAVVGPIVSFAIGVGCIAVARTLGWSLVDGSVGVIGSTLGWLGSINIVLAVFNLIPGYPLDGGRMLRAILWAVYNDVNRATRAAARVGQLVAVAFIAWGLFSFAFRGTGFNGLWLAFIGWFLMIAARASYAEVEIGEALRAIRVSDVMRPIQQLRTVYPDTPVSEALEAMVSDDVQQLAVVRDGHLEGIVSRGQIQALLQSRTELRRAS